MSQYKYAEIADTVYFWFAANTTAGAAGDGATPLYDVRLAGAAADAAPTASGTPTLLTHANYTDGLHEIAIDTTGYAAGEYAVFCTLTISTVNPAGFCGSFKLRTAGTAALGVNVVAQANIDFGALQKTSLNAATPASVQNIPATGTGLTAIPWNAAWDAEVQSECTDALNAYDPPTNGELWGALIVAKNM